VLFVYNRPDHTAKTIQALQQNRLAADSELFIYADAAKNDAAQEQVDEVRELISNTSGFKKVTVIKQEKNIGLANSIISGVTEIVNKYGKIIVLEDDIVTSIYFLQFMNESLGFYRNNNLIHSVSGCNYPTELEKLNQETYFLRIPLCWGWATWKDRWDHFDKNLEEVMSTPKDIVEYMNFNNTHDYFSQAIRNYKGDLNTWFIFWYLLSAKNKTLTLFPKKTLVNNIGHDGSGENCGDSGHYSQDIVDEKVTIENIVIKENEYALKQHELYFKRLMLSFFTRVLNKLKKVYKNHVYKK
jgi:hypothetical protein